MSAPGKISGGVGVALAHDSASRHVSGRAIYTDDIPEPPGTLQIYLALSERAHARVMGLDLTKVRTAPGVAGVFTAKDIPGKNDVSPAFGDDPLFADGLVQYVGQPMFAVAAETMQQARAAAKLALVTSEELPATITLDQAMAAEKLLEPPYTMQRGDAAKAIASAPHQLAGKIDIGGQEHFYLEGQVALAIPGEADEVTVHASTQHPSEIQHKVAELLGVASHAVTCEVRRMGGGFGGKESQACTPAAAAALVAKALNRPAKCCYDRDDDFMITGKRHDFRIEYQVGFDDEGRILGVEFEQRVRCGYSFDLSSAICDRAMFHADNAYFLPNARVTSYRYKTNTQSNTAFRGFGGPQGMIGIERVIEEIAFALGKDPLDVRRVNYYAAPDRELQTTHYGQPVEDCVIAALTDQLVETSSYRKRRAEIRAWNAQSPILKKGIALTPVKFGISFTATFLNQAGALVHVYNDGSIGLNHGGTEMGQGLFTKVAQVVAETFQVGIDRVRITSTTTAKVPNTSATAASSGSDLNGMAAKAAAETIRARIAQFLAGEQQAKIEDVKFLPGRIAVGSTEISFDEAVHRAYMGRVSLSSTGFYATPEVAWDRPKAHGKPFYYFAYGAAVTEVIIDTLTGENRILRADLLHDAGRSLNPAIDFGQIEGAYVQGAGWLTTEELVWDDKGRLRTHAPSTYKIPACSDRPPDLRMALFDNPNRKDTIYRSKAVGEPPLMLGISVLMALADAVAEARRDSAYAPLDAPATPERVLMAVEGRRQ